MPFPRRDKRAFCGKIFDTFRFLHVLFSCQCSARLTHSVKARASLSGASSPSVYRRLVFISPPPLAAFAAFLHVLRGLLRSHRRLFFIFPPFAIRRVVVRGCRRMPPVVCGFALQFVLPPRSSHRRLVFIAFPPFFGIKRARSLSGPRSAFAQALIIPAYRPSLFRTEICSSARGWNATA